MALNKRSKCYLLAKEIVKQEQKEYDFPEEDIPNMTKTLYRQILRSMVKKRFILVKVN
jgi:hypothetical protein